MVWKASSLGKADPERVSRPEHMLLIKQNTVQEDIDVRTHLHLCLKNIVDFTLEEEKVEFPEDFETMEQNQLD